MILLSIKKIAVTGTGSDRLLWKMMRSAIMFFKDSLSKIMRDSFLTKRKHRFFTRREKANHYKKDLLDRRFP